MSHNPKLRYVTALYDLNRAEYDGRTIREYKEWLRQTLIKFPNTIVFHDSCIDDELKQSFPSVLFFELPIFSLPLYKRRREIEKLCAEFSNGKSTDLVYASIDYGIVINSKFEFLRIASELVNEENFLWIDAGISRFFSHSRQSLRTNTLDSGELSLLFDLRNFLRQCIQAKSTRLNAIAPIGSSQRIVGAVTIFISKSEVASVASKYLNLVLENIQKGFWDTEQIFLSRYICSNNIKLFFQFRSNHLQMLRKRSATKRFISYQFQKLLLTLIR